MLKDYADQYLSVHPFTEAFANSYDNDLEFLSV